MGRVEVFEVIHEVAGEIEFVLFDAHHDALGKFVAP